MEDLPAISGFHSDEAVDFDVDPRELQGRHRVSIPCATASRPCLTEYR
jgi:hypothetical protein